MLGGDFGGQGSGEKIGADLKRIMDLFSEPGWGGLDNLGAIKEGLAKGADAFSETDRRNEAYLECFSSDAGQLVLQDLIDNVLLMPSAGLTPGKSVEQHAAMAIAGDAQKMLVWAFFTKMRQALDRRNQTVANKKDGGNDETA